MPFLIIRRAHRLLAYAFLQNKTDPAARRNQFDTMKFSFDTPRRRQAYLFGIAGQRKAFVFIADFNRLIAGKPGHSLKRSLAAVARFGTAVIR